MSDRLRLTGPGLLPAAVRLWIVLCVLFILVETLIAVTA